MIKSKNNESKYMNNDIHVHEENHYLKYLKKNKKSYKPKKKKLFHNESNKEGD